MARDPKRPKDFLDWLKVSGAPDWHVARLMGPLISLVLTLLFAMALIAAFVIVGATIANPESANFGTGALIVALLGAPFLIWRTVIAHRTLGYQKEGHITDRINKAVEQLGAEKEVKRDGREETVPNIEVRIGAILSLERIAQDSTRFDQGRDHVRVMEILCAYIRENSNAQAPEDYPEPDREPLRDDATEAERDAHVQAREKRFGAPGDFPLNPKVLEWAQSLTKPRADVQLALAVIGRRGADQRRVEAAWPHPPTEATVWPFDAECPRLPDKPGKETLSEAELDAYTQALHAWQNKIGDYQGYQLDLRGANLQAADMAKQHPNSSEAVFSGARFENARLEGANLTLARLEGTDLRWARLEGAVLQGVRLEGADLEGARMDGAFLWSARMQMAILERARMGATNLSFARMDRAHFTLAQMEGAQLWGARMDARTSLSGATLQGAAVKDVNLSNVPITAEQVNSIFGDASVTLPGGVTPGHADWPAHWPVWELPLGGDNDFQTQCRKWQADPANYTPPDPPPDAE